MKRVLILLLAASIFGAQEERRSSVSSSPAPLQGSQASAAPEGVFEERLLASLPRGVSVKGNFLPYALMFSQDGRQVAYVARYQVGDFMQEAVVLGDRRGPEVTFIDRVAMSPDASKVACLASFRDDILAGYLIIGNRRDQAQFKVSRADPRWEPVFSSDGKRLAYKVQTASGKHAIKVADVSDITAASHSDTTYTQLSSVSGPEFDDVDNARFSNDGTRVTYAALDHGNWFIVVDDKPGPAFADAFAPVFRPDGQAVAFAATRDKKKYFVVVGEREGPGFDQVSWVAFSPDGERVAYAAKEGSKNWIVVGAERKPSKSFPTQVVFSSDGQRVTSWSKEEGRRGRAFLIINDKPGPEFDDVGWPVFDNSATVAAYWARDKGKYVMVAGQSRSERFDGVGRTRVFSADGTELAFGVLQGSELRWKVMKIVP